MIRQTKMGDGTRRFSFDLREATTPEGALLIRGLIRSQFDSRYDEVLESAKLVGPEGAWDDLTTDRIVKGVKSILDESQLVLWKQDIFDAAWTAGVEGEEVLCADPISEESLSATIPCAELWMTERMRNPNRPMGSILQLPEHCAMLAGLVVPIATQETPPSHGLSLILFCMGTASSEEEANNISRSGTVITRILYPAFENQALPWIYAPWWSCSSFLRGHLASLQPARSSLSRQQKRWRERTGRSLPDLSRVSVVVLRRRDGQHHYKDAPEPVEWQHQWVVSGHWRRQWYPSRGEHRPRFVDAYVKGPEDKPLLPPKVLVYAARR